MSPEDLLQRAEQRAVEYQQGCISLPADGHGYHLLAVEFLGGEMRYTEVSNPTGEWRYEGLLDRAGALWLIRELLFSAADAVAEAERIVGLRA